MNDLHLKILLNSYVNHKKLPGVLFSIVDSEKCLFKHHTGYRNVENQEPMDFDTILQIASLTKLVTSLVTLMFVEKGRLSFDDPLHKFFPEFKNIKVLCKIKSGYQLEDIKTHINIHHLLTHTSGLSYVYTAESKLKRSYKELQLFDPSSTSLEFLAKLSATPLNFQPGTAWRYGVSTDVLGFVLEKIADQPLDLIFKETIFDPLNMKDSAFYVPENKLNRFATVYGPNKKGGLHIVESPTNSKYRTNRTLLSGGGGLVSTMNDFIKLGKVLLKDIRPNKNRLLSADFVKRMTSNQLPSGLACDKFSQNVSYEVDGYGFAYGMKIPEEQSGKLNNTKGMAGWAGVTNSYFMLDASKEKFFLFFTHFIPFSYYPIEADIKNNIDSLIKGIYSTRNVETEIR